MEKSKNKRVIIAMSGGIDSSVAAALLKKERYDVIGVFMKFWSEPPSGSSRQICADSNADLRRWENKCCSTEAEKRARKVAEILDIPFYVFNFEKEFKKKVVDYFLKANKLGLTPNPCVVCNKEIKFGLLFKKMLLLDADYIATGHYVRKRGTKLLRAKDKEKDQSYFLWKLNQKILKRTLFPIGDYTKAEVRKLAEKFKLPVLDIPESQEICFIQTTIHPVKSRKAGVPLSAGQFNRVNDFLRKYLKTKPGRIVNTQGKIIGEHRGLWFYTIGQRRGIELSNGPYYVLDKDIKKNILIVTKNENDLYKRELITKNINWIHPVKYLRVISPSAKLFNRVKVKAKIRYRHKSVPATIYYLKSNIYHLEFDRPQRAITPGQSVVFYLPAQISKKFVAGKGQELLGGGIIS